MASQNEYEMVFILHPSTPEDQLSAQIDKVKEYVTVGGGEVTSVESGAPWGRRRLAYTVKKVNEGYYSLMRMTLPASALPELERNLKLMESLLRYMIVRP